jgi:VanZ family protein
MGFIFYMSSINGVVSNKQSFAVVKTVRSESKAASQNKPQKSTIDKRINLFVRKNAHAFEYLILSILTANALLINKIKGKASLPIIMFVCLFYAVLDEFHQSFIPGRTAMVNDILIDFAGCLIGILIYFLGLRRLWDNTPHKAN